MKRVLISFGIMIGLFALVHFLGIVDMYYLFSQVFSGNFGIGVEDMVYFRYVAFVLIAAALYYVLSNTGIPHNKALQIIFSVAIASVSIFISNEEFYAILQSYVALIFAILMGLLFFVIYMITRKIYPPENDSVDEEVENPFNEPV